MDAGVERGRAAPQLRRCCYFTLNFVWPKAQMKVTDRDRRTTGVAAERPRPTAAGAISKEGMNAGGAADGAAVPVLALQLPVDVFNFPTRRRRLRCGRRKRWASVWRRLDENTSNCCRCRCGEVASLTKLLSDETSPLRSLVERLVFE